jgi:twitching motility two-component system response regulator PilG
MRDWQNIRSFQAQQTRRGEHLEGYSFWPERTHPVDGGQLFSSPFLQAGQVVPKKMIVVVDDSLTVRKIMEACLGRAGFEVQTFEDGVAFFHWLLSPQGRVPDLLFLDLMLPKIDGYDIARQFKANPRFHQTILLFLSQRDGVLDRLKGRLVGARGYLTKPFRIEDILTVVLSALGLTQSDT